MLRGDPDAGGWALCYALAMSGTDKEILLDEEAEIEYNGHMFSFAQFSPKVGYLDREIGLSLWDRRKTVAQLIQSRLRKAGSPWTAEDVIRLFELDEQRRHRPLAQTGNEFFRARAAIEFAAGKEVFCFPWLSARQMQYYSVHLQFICSLLEKQKKIVLLPISVSDRLDGWTHLDVNG
ncbi:MAG: hypothetical protein IJF56_08865 [Clostridia bacterium]|nr:hypothetical protein [Clostridia bacterium]